MHNYEMFCYILVKKKKLAKFSAVSTSKLCETRLAFAKCYNLKRILGCNEIVISAISFFPLIKL